MSSKPTALDWIMGYADGIADPKKIAAARRELSVLRELCEADDAIDEMKYHGSIVEAVERRAKAREAYRRWLAEQEKQA